MRVLIVTTFFPNTVNRHRTVFVKNLVCAMRTFATLNVVAPVPYAPPIPAKPRWDVLRRVPSRENIDGMDVFHPRFIVLPRLNFFSGVGYFFGVLRTLYVIKCQFDPDVIHVHCGYPDSVGVACAARILNLPYVVTVHGSDMNVYGTKHGLRQQIRWALNGALGVIAVSNDLAAKVKQLTGGLQHRIVYIPCAGFDPTVFFMRSREGSRRRLAMDPTSRVVVFVGHLVPIKGVEFLLDAWALLRQRNQLTDDDRLLVIGEGVCSSALERRVTKGGFATGISFTGVVSQIDVAHWIAAADLLCLPSLNEGTPNVIVEALAMGIPVVASRVGGIPELVRDDVNGMLVEPNQSVGLADALHHALSRNWNPSEIRASVAHLTWDALARENYEFLDTVVRDQVLN